MSNCVENYFNQCSRCGNTNNNLNCQQGFCIPETQTCYEYEYEAFYTPAKPIPTVCTLGFQAVYGSSQTKLVHMWITKQEQEARKRKAQEAFEAKRVAQLNETFAWISKCEHTSGLCGCSECTNLHKIARNQGVKDFELLACKIMDLESGTFAWNESALERLFVVQFKD